MAKERKTAVLIVNPVSGRRRSLTQAHKASRILEEAGLECLMSQTARPGHGREIARTQGDKVDVLVSIGGDGTLNEAVNGLADICSDTPVAVIPTGTANMVAKELGLPKDFTSLVNLAVKSDLRRLDLGQVGQRRFILCASAGFDASVIQAMARRRPKRGLTLWRYLPLIFSQEVRYRFAPIRVKVDGNLVDERSTNTIIGNMAGYGGFFRMFKEASPEDGLLDVCCLKGSSLGDLVRYAWAAYRGRLYTLKDVTFYRGKHIMLEADVRVLFQIDGDPWGELPIDVEVLPQAVTLCVPG